MNWLKRLFHLHNWRDVPGMIKGHELEQCACGAWRKQPIEESEDDWIARQW